jgi:putative endonuclease
MEKSLIESFDLSRFGEEEACKFLKRQRLKILDRNFRAASGEIDIVAASGKTVIFIEVKTRSSARYAQPWEAVGFRKRNNIKAAARSYVHQHSLSGRDFRFDVVSILVDDSLKPRIEWIQQAFE